MTTINWMTAVALLVAPVAARADRAERMERRGDRMERRGERLVRRAVRRAVRR